MPNRDLILDRPVVFLSKSDPVLASDAVEGTLITGAPGGGKAVAAAVNGRWGS